MKRMLPMRAGVRPNGHHAQRTCGRSCFGIIATAIALLIAGCGEGQNQAIPQMQNTPPAVSVLAVASRPFTASVEFIGKTEAYRKVDIRARVTGFLVEQAFTEGGTIAESDLLYRIDPSEYDAALASANAGLAGAQAALVEADQKLRRTRTLAGQGNVSKATLDTAIAGQGKAKADVAGAQANVDRAQLDLGYTQIGSPIDGRVGKSAVDVGNLIGPDSGILATVITQEPVRVVFSVSEQEFLNVRKARDGKGSQKFVPRIRLANGEIYSHPGKFQFLDNQVDPSTGTIRIYVEFPNPESVLLPGLFVTVILSSEDAEERILVPQSAIQLNQAGPFVLVVSGENRVEARAVKTGERAGAEIVVSEGLAAGETIILEGIQKVRPGIEVVAVPVNTSTAGR